MQEIVQCIECYNDLISYNFVSEKLNMHVVQAGQVHVVIDL